MIDVGDELIAVDTLVVSSERPRVPGARGGECEAARGFEQLRRPDVPRVGHDEDAWRGLVGWCGVQPAEVSA